VRPTIEPETDAERQALEVLASARRLAAEIESRRRALRDGPGGASHRDGKAGLIEAAERLVNLLALVLHRADRDLRPSLAEHVRETVAAIRQELLGTSRNLVLDRAVAVTRRAEAAMDARNGYPIGLAGRLAEILSAIDQTVQVLGGAAMMNAEEQSALATACQSVVRLTELEDSLVLIPAVA